MDFYLATNDEFAPASPPHHPEMPDRTFAKDYGQMVLNGKYFQ